MLSVISLPLLICLIGLFLWIIFAKTQLSDPLVARVGEIMFGVGLLAYLLMPR